jgi:hypothetical protein
MSVQVPTAADFDALSSRVAALEAAQPKPPPTTGESPSGTTISAGSGVIYDAQLDRWTVDASAVLCINGYQDGFTPPVVTAVYSNHALYFMKTSGAWYTWTGTAWLASSDPTVVVPPQPVGPVSDPSGIMAHRVVDVLNGFGANCFPNGQDGAGSNAGPNAHVAALRAIWGSSGIVPLLRIYAAADPTAQIAWCRNVLAGFPNARFTACVSDFASADGLVQIIQASKADGGWLKCAEGYNEPNNTTSFGFGPTTPAQCLSAQQKVYAAAQAAGIPTMSPSVADMTGDPNFIQNYYGSASTLQSIIAASDLANIHNYPNRGSPNHELQARTEGISRTYGGLPPATSEFHPLLYNNTADETLGALYTAFAKLSGALDWQQQILTWFCLWDYANTFAKPVGLFHGNDPTLMRPSATLMSNLIKICGDSGATAASFVPGRLDMTVTGLPLGYNNSSGGSFGVMQRSDGVFLVAFWNEQDAASGATSQIGVTFNAGPKSKIVRYSFGNPLVATPTTQVIAPGNGISFTMRQPDLQVIEVHQ